METDNIIDTNLAHKDHNGIWIPNTNAKTDQETLTTWENIYNFDEKQLIQDRELFFKEKLEDHIKYILSTFKFDQNTIYLEIGCGPSYIAEYLMKNFDVTFIGIDFNYEILFEIKKYFEKIGLTKFILIHSDITDMPIKENSVDFVYGGGVIEHLPNTEMILTEIFRVLKDGGISFNTVPAFNLWWFTRFWNNIPAMGVLKVFFEYIHIKLLKYKVLSRYYGYELSYMPNSLKTMHKHTGFSSIDTNAFAISPSTKIMTNNFFRNIYMWLSSNIFTCPVYYVSARK